MGKFIDLTGQTFGRWSVICRADDYVSPNTGKRTTMWLCRCNCGNPEIKAVMGSRLKNGQSKSCGCLQREVAVQSGRKNKKYNAYNLSGEYGVGYTSRGIEFYFDLEDYKKIKDYCWRTDPNGYIMANIYSNKVCLMHRFLLNPQKKHASRPYKP